MDVPRRTSMRVIKTRRPKVMKRVELPAKTFVNMVSTLSTRVCASSLPASRDVMLSIDYAADESLRSKVISNLRGFLP